MKWYYKKTNYQLLHEAVTLNAMPSGLKEMSKWLGRVRVVRKGGQTQTLGCSVMINNFKVTLALESIIYHAIFNASFIMP